MVMKVPSWLRAVDPWIVVPLLLLFGLSLATMTSFSDATGSLFNRQLLWMGLSILLLVLTANIDISFSSSL